jgi:hypothetical protein
MTAFILWAIPAQKEFIFSGDNLGKKRRNRKSWG